MSSKIRYVAKIAGSYMYGAYVLQKLAAYSCTTVKTREDAIRAARLVPGTILWVFQEPRRLKKKLSRYQKLCACLGLMKKERLDWAPEAAPQRGVGRLRAQDLEPRPQFAVPEGYRYVIDAQGAGRLVANAPNNIFGRPAAQAGVEGGQANGRPGQ